MRGRKIVYFLTRNFPTSELNSGWETLGETLRTPTNSDFRNVASYKRSIIMSGNRILFQTQQK